MSIKRKNRLSDNNITNVSSIFIPSRTAHINYCFGLCARILDMGRLQLAELMMEYATNHWAP